MEIFWIILLSLIGLYLLFIVGPVIASFLGVFRQKTPKYPWEEKHPEEDSAAPYLEEMRADVERLERRPVQHVARRKGKLQLCADYYPGESEKTLVLCHGFCVRPLTNFAGAANEFLEKGYNIFLPYSRAHTPSRGGRPSLGVVEEEDLLEWIDWLFENTNTEEAVLWGISMGCATIAYASDKLDGGRVKGMILDCGFESPYGQYIRDSRQRHLPIFLMRPVARLVGLCAFHKDLKVSVEESLKKTKIPALFLHGEEDRTVPISVGRKNFEACASKKEFLAVPGAAHALCYQKLSEEGDTTVDRFLKRCFNDDTEA
ncbi:MAG: alpha/beta fold hydrolase [Clostridia bacterium]|nr:alpha/beta fold hydrolase [Clostridia bacterium]